MVLALMNCWFSDIQMEDFLEEYIGYNIGYTDYGVLLFDSLLQWKPNVHLSLWDAIDDNNK